MERLAKHSIIDVWQGFEHASDNPHCVKGVRIWSFSGSHFPALGLNTDFPAFQLNTERYSVPLRIQSERGKIRTRKTTNTNTFHAVPVSTHNAAKYGHVQLYYCIQSDLAFFLYVYAVHHKVIVVNFLAFSPTGIYLFKVNNRSTRTVFEIGSKLKTKNTEQHLVSLLLIYASRSATFLKNDSNTGVFLRILRNF